MKIYIFQSITDTLISAFVLLNDNIPPFIISELQVYLRFLSFGFRFTITVVARYKCIKLYPVLQEFNLQCILNLVKIETFGAMNCRHNVTIELVFCLMHFLLFNLSFKSFKSRICQFSFWFNGNSKFQMTSCLGFRKYLMAESRKAPRIRYGYAESIFMSFFFTKV